MGVGDTGRMKRPVALGLVLVLGLCLVVLSAQEASAEDRYLEFFPWWKGAVPANGSVVTWDSPCFHEVQAKMTEFGDKGARIEFSSSKPKSELCSDLYLVATDESFIPYWDWHRDGSHVSIDKWKSPGEQQYVSDYGVQVFLIQNGTLGFLEDLLATYQLFFSKKHSTEDALQFLKDYMNITLVPKAQGVPAKLIPDESELLSGDCLQLFKFGTVHGAINAVEAYGTGGRADHVAALLWINGSLYVVESMGGGEGPQGIIKTPYSEWMSTLDPDYLVALLRLNDERRALFDESAAVEFFLSVEGMPYGFHNYFFGWVDTVADNYPPPLSMELIPILFAIMDRVDFNISNKMWGLALNQRLGTENLHVDQIIDLCDQKNLSIYDVITWPEQDSWTYPDGKSLTCSSFVMAMYKAAGVFPNITFQATELTPRDSYSINIYANQGEWQQPAACAQDPFNSQNNGWCQISGTYVFELPEFNTIDPFSDMFQKCGGLPVDYVRTPGC